MAEGVHRDAVVADDDPVDGGRIGVPKAIGVAALQGGEDLLDEQACVRAALDDRTAPPGIGRRSSRGARRIRDCGTTVYSPANPAGISARNSASSDTKHVSGRRPPCTSDEAVPEMDQDVVQVAHAHVTVEALDPDLGVGLGRHQVQQVVGVVERRVVLRPPRRSPNSAAMSKSGRSK